VYSFNESLNGVIGLVNCLRKEPDGNMIRCFFIDDPSAPEFDLCHPFYSAQFSLGMALNIYRNVSVILIFLILKYACFIYLLGFLGKL